MVELEGPYKRPNFKKANRNGGPGTNTPGLVVSRFDEQGNRRISGVTSFLIAGFGPQTPP